MEQINKKFRTHAIFYSEHQEYTPKYQLTIAIALKAPMTSIACHGRLPARMPRSSSSPKCVPHGDHTPLTPDISALPHSSIEIGLFTFRPPAPSESRDKQIFPQHVELPRENPANEVRSIAQKFNNALLKLRSSQIGKADEHVAALKRLSDIFKHKLEFEPEEHLRPCKMRLACTCAK